MSDMHDVAKRLILEQDSKHLHEIASFYRMMMKEFNVQSRLSVGPPNYSMTLYFQSHLEDEASFYDRVTRVLDERIEELNEG